MMIMIGAVVFSIFSCLAFPWVLGVIFKNIFRKSMLPAYLLGHSIQFVTLYVAGKAITYLEISLYRFTLVYASGAILLSVLVLTLFRKRWKQIIITAFRQINIGILVAEVVLTLISILFLLPHSADLTEQILRGYLATGGLVDNRYFLYAICMTAGGVPVTFFVRVILPICFLPLFYTTYHYLAGGRKWFLKFAYTIYASLVFVESQVCFEVFLNIWNPLTLGITVWLPLVYVYTTKLVWAKERGIEQYIELCILVLAFQSLVAKGWIYIGAIIVMTMLVRIMYSVIAHCGGRKNVVE